MGLHRSTAGMKAVIMAGGQGTRLRPLTSNQPKPMLPVANRPIMEHGVHLLKTHGITSAVATIQFLGSIVRSYFGNGEDSGVQLAYATEETPLGTAGSVKNGEDLLRDGTFLVVSGDALTDIDLSALVDHHRASGGIATICLKSVENPLDFGIVITREDGQIERFLEKPSWGQVFSDTINTGIYVLEPEIFDYIPDDTFFDFSSDLFPLLLDKGLPIYGHVADGYWCDVGQFETYLQAHTDVLDARVDVDIPGFAIGNRVWLGEGAEVDPEARIDGPVLIGENCRVEAGAHIREYTVLGANVLVKEGAFLHRAVVHDNAYIGSGANLRGCVVGKNTDVRATTRIEPGAVIGDDCSIGDGAIINPNVRVYPFKSVESGAIVNKSVIWETRGARTLFGEEGVSGLVNVDVTPEVAVRVAMAYGSVLKKGSVLAASRDGSRAARALKRAVVAGLNMAGIHSHDLEATPAPVARYYVRTRRVAGGILLRTAEHDPQAIRISFSAPDGTDLDESSRRKIERTYYREEFRRAYIGELGELHYPPRAFDYYTEGLLAAVDADVIERAGLKLVVDYAFGTPVLVMPGILGRLGCEVLGVNTAVDESKSVMTRLELTARLDRLSELVTSSRSDLGVLLGSTGERLYLVDDTGRVVEPGRVLALMVSLLHPPRPGAGIAIPVSTSRQVATLAEDNGLVVHWTKTQTCDLMETSLDEDIVLAGTVEGDLLFPSLVPSPDGMMGLAKLLELRAASGRDLSGLLAALPRPFVVHETVPCPWESKGTVMRKLVEGASGDRVELLDGVKVHHGEDWYLVLPDPEQPLVHVWAEGGSESSARSLAGTQVRLVRTLVG